MTRRLRPAHLLHLACVLLVLAALPAVAAARFELGLDDPGLGGNGTRAQTSAAEGALAAMDGSVARIGIDWASVAPSGSRAPAGFEPSDPADPRYHWGAVDTAVRAAAQHRLRPLIVFSDAPRWAEPATQRSRFAGSGAWDPDPTAYAAFVHAAAVRYGGSFADPVRPGAKLPRVSAWESWDEPNLASYFSAPHPVSAYRTLLNRAYAALKAVHRDNTVVLGGLAPVSSVPGSIAPLQFGAQLLCLHLVSGAYRPSRPCRQHSKFDVFGIHPYSLAATPTKRAYKPGDVLVGDMPEVQALVSAADRLHTDAPREHHRIWVTEFAWPTNPPNTQLGDREPTAARYVAYSMYEMWRSGVSLVVWVDALDEAGSEIPGSGLYTSAGLPKLILRAFSFPVIASVSGAQGLVWGRAPQARPAQIVVEHAVGRGWRPVARAVSGSGGVFLARFRARGNGLYRASVVGGPTSLAYNSVPIAPRRIHLP